MEALRHHEFTVEVYFEFELQSSARFEFYNGAILAMAGASPRHNNIMLKTQGALDRRVGKRCRVLGEGQRVVTGDELYTYADAMVACGPLDLLTVQGTGTVRNPSILVEVLSPSTRVYDLGEKLQHYKTIASLKEVLFVEQERVDVLHVRRSPTSPTGWEEERFVMLADSIPLQTLSKALTLKEVYDRAFEL